MAKYMSHWEPWEEVLRELGWERTRENFIRVLYDDPPATWDGEAEAQLPPDLRMWPPPAVPFPD
jgi:hypothetical protein